MREVCCAGTNRRRHAHQRRAAPLKALRHESPDIETTAKRLGVSAGNRPWLSLKNAYTAHAGKMSIVGVLAAKSAMAQRCIRPSRSAGRVSGTFKLMGNNGKNAGPPRRRTVALGKLDGAKTGETLSSGKQPHKPVAAIKPFAPVLAIAVAAKERKDDVKLGQALHKLLDEDPSITVVHNAEAHEVVLWGQGEMHLRVATERLAERFGVAIEKHKPSVGYRETIKKGIQQRGRHKKQSGGHGQFGDVVLDVKPLPRGSGFTFKDSITGGVVPRNYIPSVEEGVVDGLKKGPLGFPVVDVAVTLIAARTTPSIRRSGLPHRRPHRRGRGLAAMNPCCSSRSIRSRSWRHRRRPQKRTPSCPAAAARSSASIRAKAGRLGLRAGVDAGIGDRRPDHRNPLGDGRVGSFSFKFDHMAELVGRNADQIVAARKTAA